MKEKPDAEIPGRTDVGAFVLLQVRPERARAPDPK